MEFARLRRAETGGPAEDIIIGALTTIGRAPGNSVVVDDPRVSRHHVVIRVHEDGSYVVSDLGSANGTQLNGRRVLLPERLRHNDVLTVGSTALTFIHPPSDVARVAASGDEDATHRSIVMSVLTFVHVFNVIVGGLIAAFAPSYDEESGRHSRLYAGAVAGLDAMAAQGLLLACVTNKAQRFTQPLLERFGVAQRFQAIVCGDMVARGKPDPLPYLHACAQLEVLPSDALVVGDSANDVAAARAAGMRVVCVPYGYNEGRPVASLQADAVLRNLQAVAEYLSNLKR